MDDVSESLRKKIEELEAALKGYREALNLIQKSQAAAGDKNMRFFQMRPLYAMRAVLRENGGRMLRQKLTDAIVDGGIMIGRKRAGHNIRIAYETNIDNGNLIADGDYIVLPSSDPEGIEEKE